LLPAQPGNGSAVPESAGKRGFLDRKNP